MRCSGWISSGHIAGSAPALLARGRCGAPGACVLAYLEHLAQTSTAKDVAADVSVASSTLNELFRSVGLCDDIAGGYTASALREDLRRSESIITRKSLPWTPEIASACTQQWGFGRTSSGAFATSSNRGQVLRWCDIPYRRWVALLQQMAFEAVCRFDDLSWVCMRTIRFACQRGWGSTLRVLSFAFLRRKNMQHPEAEWMHLPDVGPRCAYRLAVSVCRSQFGWRVDTDAEIWMPPVTTGFLFPYRAVAVQLPGAV